MLTVRDMAVAGKRVLVRVDFNVPLNSEYQITDKTRINKALPTIQFLLENGASVILMSHLGRPQKKLNEDGTVNREKFTLRHLIPTLSEKLGRQVQMAEDCAGPDSKQKADRLQPGEVLLIENTRFDKGESKGDESLAEALSDLADMYVNDAFGTAHRAHSSTAIAAKYFEPNTKGIGFLMEAELENGEKVLSNPSRPFVAILGGAKVSDKILLIERLLEFADEIIVGGGMAYTFIKAKGGSIGNSLCEEDKLDLANELLAKADALGKKIHLPVDSTIGNEFSADAEHQQCPSDSIPDGWLGMDIGLQARRDFGEVILNAETILWNGPMGVFEFETFSHGSFYIAEQIAQSSDAGAYSLVGGGDSVSAVNKSGVADRISFISTGGGAMLEFLEGKTLPGVAALK